MNKQKNLTDQEKAERLKQCGNIITATLTVALVASAVGLVNAVANKDKATLDKIDQIK